jgi:pilus assembly protein Flp/PilA
MGAPARADAVCDAAGRFAAYPDVARSALKVFARATAGATAIEYAMIASLISIVIFASAKTIGTTILEFFNSLASYV